MPVYSGVNLVRAITEYWDFFFKEERRVDLRYHIFSAGSLVELDQQLAAFQDTREILYQIEDVDVRPVVHWMDQVCYVEFWAEEREIP